MINKANEVEGVTEDISGRGRDLGADASLANRPSLVVDAAEKARLSAEEFTRAAAKAVAERLELAGK